MTSVFGAIVARRLVFLRILAGKTTATSPQALHMPLRRDNTDLRSGVVPRDWRLKQKRATVRMSLAAAFVVQRSHANSPTRAMSAWALCLASAMCLLPIARNWIRAGTALNLAGPLSAPALIELALS